MDWIEQTFGIAPDLGSGSLEFGLATLPILLWCLWRAAHRSRKRQRA